MRRQWRIGTFSMGLMLILLGVTLLLTTTVNEDMLTIAISWWPALLIVVGIEILVYLFLAKSENSFLRFDLMSILFVGIIGFFGIGFTVFTSLGLLDEVKSAISGDVHTGALPNIEHTIDEDIEKIIVKTEFLPVEVEKNQSNSIVIFGTYKSTFIDDPEIKDADIAQMVKAGNTLYVQFLEGAYHNGLHYQAMEIFPTIVVPESVEVIVEDRSM